MKINYDFTIFLCLFIVFLFFSGCSTETDKSGDEYKGGGDDDDIDDDDDLFNIADDDDDDDDDYYSDDDYGYDYIGYSATGNTCLKVDANDKVHITYYVLKTVYAYYGGAFLSYATETNGDWENNPIISFNLRPYSNSLFGDFHSLDVDSDNDVHLIFNSIQGDSYNPQQGQIEYAVHDGEAWGEKEIASLDGADSNSLLIDDNKHAHILQVGPDTQFDPSLFSYTTNQSGSWETTLLDDTNIGWGTSLSMNPADGALNVFYGKDAVGYLIDIYFITDSSGIWSAPDLVVDDVYQLSLASVLDLQGRPNLLCGHSEDGLLYFLQEEKGWSPVVLDSVQKVYYVSADIDDSNNIHVVYITSPDSYIDRLLYASFPVGQTTPLTPESIFQGTYLGEHSISLDGDGFVHISFVADRDLNYSTNKSGQWETVTLFEHYYE